jgi:outer membrane protein assembly factor BamA
VGGVLREAGYRTARVETPREERQGAQVSLVVEVHTGPRWGLRFVGNRLLPSSLLEVVVGELVADPEDRAAVESAAARLEEYYRFRGFLEAEVSVRQHRAPDGERALLVFDIREDLPWLVREVRFDGRSAIPEAELRALLLEQLRAKVPQVEGARAPLAEPLELEGRAPEGHQRTALLPDPGSVFVEEAWRESAEQLTQLYRGRGHLSARVELASVSLDSVRRTVAIAFGVEEGPLTLVESVELEGLPAEISREALQLPPPQTPFSPALGERVRATLDDALARNGYVFAQVEGRASLSADGTLALLRYEVEPGPQVHVGKVVLKGLERTDPELVRGQLSLVEGSPLDPEQLRVTQRNLSLLGHFRQVTVRPVAPEVREPVKDVVVEVRERPRAEGQVAAGYFVAEGPRLLVEADFPNLFESGFTLQSRLRGNYVALSLVDSLRALEGFEALGGQGSLSLVSPRVATPVGQFGTQVDAIAERVFRPAFTFNRLAGVLGADVVNGWFSVALQAELELDDVDTLGSNDLLRVSEIYVDPERGRFPNGRFTLWATRLTATGDFRDDPANTRSGGLVSVSAELMDDFFATFRHPDGRVEEGSLNSLKLSANLTGYLPLGKRTVLAASLRGGDILLRPGAETIAPRRFFLGGWASMRGFREDGVLPADLRTTYHEQRNACRALATQAGCTAAAQLLESGSDLRSEGGNRFVLGKLELRLPLFSALDLGIFAEAGNLWLESPQKWKDFELRYVAGAGLRLRTPVGPVAFDLGLNLSPDREVNEQPASMHFSIGLF